MTFLSTAGIQSADIRDFPGAPGVKALCFHCRGHGFNPWLGNSDSAGCTAKTLGDNIVKLVSKGCFRVAGCQISQILALYLGHTTRLAGSQFPHEGSHVDPSSENSKS